MNRLALGIAVTLLAHDAAIRAADWPQFRGPNGQGRSAETGFPLKWTPTENVAWKTPIPGESWSSPIVWGERVFVTTATDGGKSCRLLSLDRKTGKVLWDKELFQQTPLRKEGRNTYATPTPATDGERVYACYGDGSFAAVDFAGKIVWTNRDYKFYGQHGLGSSPILYEGRLIMARDGSSDGEDKALGWQKPWDQSYVVALDAKTGKELWKGKRGMSRISHGIPAIWEHDGQAELVSEAGDVLQGFDVRTGKRLWSHEVAGEGKVPSATLGDGLVFAAGGWGGKESIKAFRLGGEGDFGETRLAWEQRKGMPKVPSLLFVKPHLFAVTDGGVATCMNAATGDIRWQKRIGGSFSASPVAAENRVYFLADDGETTVVEAGPEFKQLAKNPLGERVQASLALSQGQVFLRTEKHLFCIGKKNANDTGAGEQGSRKHKSNNAKDRKQPDTDKVRDGDGEKDDAMIRALRNLKAGEITYAKLVAAIGLPSKHYGSGLAILDYRMTRKGRLARAWANGVAPESRVFRIVIVQDDEIVEWIIGRPPDKRRE